MRVEAVEASTAFESASSPPMSETSTSCAGNVERPAFLDDEDAVVSSDDDDKTNDEEKDYKLLHLRSEMFHTEALLKEFRSDEASRKLRIELIHKDVQLYEQQYKMRRMLQSQSESSTRTSFAASLTPTSSQTEPIDTNKTSQKTQADLHKEEQNISEKSSTLVSVATSAVNNSEDEEDKETALEKDEAMEEASAEETSNVADECPPTSNADLAIEIELNGDNNTKEKVDNELKCDGQQEPQALAEEETKEQCPQDTNGDRGVDEEVQETKSEEAPTPLITMDSPDFMSKIAMRFKALDGESMDKTTMSSQADVADEPMPKKTAEEQVEGDDDVFIGDEDDAEDQNSDNGDDNIIEEEEDVNDTSARAATRPRIKATKKDKRKKRVTGGGTSTLYSTFKPPQLKNNKRQRRRK